MGVVGPPHGALPDLRTGGFGSNSSDRVRPYGYIAHVPAVTDLGLRVYAFFRRWREHGLIAEFHDRLRGKVREREGREAEPAARIIDAQSVRAAATVPAASRGYDGGKKVPAASGTS